ncbi:hypothetical protein [Lysobacter fragariae]
MGIARHGRRNGLAHGPGSPAGSPQPAEAHPATTTNADAQTEALQAIGIVSSLKGLVGWIGGSLAGITAILYGCGYLITTAHIYALGLSNLVDFDKDYFLLEGAKFLLAVVTSIGPGAVDPVAILAAMALLPIIAGLIFLRGHFLALWRPASAWYAARANGDWAVALKVTFYGVLLITSAVIAFECLQAILRHLRTSDLLYLQLQGDACNLKPPGLPAALVCRGNDAFREEEFGKQLWATIKLIVIACVAWRFVGRWRYRAALVTPFAIFAGLTLLMLPMDFGALMKPTRYPLVRVALADATTATGNHFLIDRNDKGLTLWDPATREVHWVPLSDVKRMDADGVQDLFDPGPHAGPDASGESP